LQHFTLLTLQEDMRIKVHNPQKAGIKPCLHAWLTKCKNKAFNSMSCIGTYWRLALAVALLVDKLVDNRLTLFMMPTSAWTADTLS